MKRLILLLVCLLLPATTWAFPDNAVLETFTNADGTLLPTHSANWTNIWTTTNVGTRIEGNGAARVSTAGFGNSYYNATTFGPNCEAYATIVTVAAGAGYHVACRLVDVGLSTTEGYSIGFTYPSTVTISIRTNGLSSALGSTITKALAVGDSVGIRIVGSNICAWHKPAAGSWAEIGCRVDGTYSAAGKIGFAVGGDIATAQIDNFGGGTVTACTGASPTWTAVDLTQTAVTDCISVASAGDTINLPAGTGTWSTRIGQQFTASVILNKGVTLHGETVCSGTPVTCVAGTTINDGTDDDSGENMLSVTGTNARVTGISFHDPRNIDDSGPMMTLSCSNCRLDHCAFSSTNNINEPRGAVFYSKVNATQLADHNYSHNVNTFNVEGAGSGDGLYAGNYSWTVPMVWGDANATYIEDNNFDDSLNHINDGAFDLYSGSRMVFRFNTITNGVIGAHGLDSGSKRSPIRQEVYRNIIDNNGSAKAVSYNMRGGTLLIWDNIILGSFTNPFWIQNYRSDGTSCVNCGGWGTLCGGGATGEAAINLIDQNTAPYASHEGNACRDQPGRGPSTAPLTDWPQVSAASSVYSQELIPIYGWGNLFNGSLPNTNQYVIRTGADGNNSARLAAFHVLRDRDLYTEHGVTAFDGTTGTGEGTLAARPATCTTGVAYFATNQGSWNTSTTDAAYNPGGVAGVDGILFHCVSTNTWDTVGTGAYTPYTYPHPLQAFEEGGDLPTAPTNLRIITESSGNRACLVWSASSLTNLAGYRIYHGTASGSYDPAVSIAINSVNTRHTPDTQYCYTSHVGGTHYFSVTAYDTQTLETELATEVSATFTALARATATARSGR